ncbi:hypothetical protein [Halorientalis sp. IM1011]|uniref:hypothetical protein n=2 Tax=Halorientalis sp. IM1011 TaxID=1932360 RepID=UPI0020A2E1A5|nr:hypothetical protein [Halorientalis sp. IM1011]
MDSGVKTVIFVVVGLLVVAIAATTLSPAGDRTMVSEVVSEGDTPRDATVMDYSDLPRSAQSAVDEVVQEGSTTLSTYDDYRAVNALEGYRYIRTDEGVFYIRTTSADGSGGLFEGIVRDSILAIGGLLIGAGIFVRKRRHHLHSLIALPTGATVALLSANAFSAPTLSVVNWLGNISFGLTAGVPVLTGIALQQRDYYIGVMALSTLILSVVVLFSGNKLSALYLLLPLLLLGLPGVGFGLWLEKRSGERS